MIEPGGDFLSDDYQRLILPAFPALPSGLQVVMVGQH